MSNYSGATTLDLLFWPGVGVVASGLVYAFLYWRSR